jgi:hypothetical protein
MTDEQRRHAGLLGNLVLTQRIREGQADVAENVAHETVAGTLQAVAGTVTILPDFSSAASVAQYLATIADRVTRRELAPSQANSATAAAVAALRAIELQNEINLLSREVAVVRDRLSSPSGSWRRS